MDGERMHAAGELVRERRIDHAMALQPALSAEGFRHDIDSEMTLAARPMARMARVLMRFILDVETFGCESLAQLFRDQIAGMHERWLSQHLRMWSIANHVQFCRLSSLEAAMQPPA
jgi:hypothetical protein